MPGAQRSGMRATGTGMGAGWVWVRNGIAGVPYARSSYSPTNGRQLDHERRARD